MFFLADIDQRKVDLWLFKQIKAPAAGEGFFFFSQQKSRDFPLENWNTSSPSMFGDTLEFIHVVTWGVLFPGSLNSRELTWLGIYIYTWLGTFENIDNFAVSKQWM